MTTPLAFLPKVRSEALRKSADGQPCALRIASFLPAQRCAPESTVVLCHVSHKGSAGTGTKPCDLNAVYGCATCHDLLDRRDSRMTYILENHPLDLMRRVIAAFEETHARMIEAGLIVIPKGQIK